MPVLRLLSYALYVLPDWMSCESSVEAATWLI